MKRAGKLRREVELAVKPGCVSRAGVRRPKHELDRDGICFWCDERPAGRPVTKEITMKIRNLSVAALLCLIPFWSHAQDFDPRAVAVETQAWWAPDFGHIHSAVRLPFGQTVSGILDLDVRIVLHNNPSRLFRVYLTTEDDNIKFVTGTDLVCPYDGVTETNCAWSVPLRVDTAAMPEGWREIRLKAKATTPDGKTFYVSSSFGVYVDNGSASDTNNSKFSGTSKPLSGLGYYDTLDAATVKFEDVPRAPISGTYVFRVRTSSNSLHLTVDLDKSHFIPAVGSWPEQPASVGVTLFDQDGTFSSTVQIPVDTLTLANGWHAIAAKSTGITGLTSTCSYCGSEINRLAGVGKFWFYVQN